MMIRTLYAGLWLLVGVFFMLYGSFDLQWRNDNLGKPELVNVSFRFKVPTLPTDVQSLASWQNSLQQDLARNFGERVVTYQPGQYPTSRLMTPELEAQVISASKTVSANPGNAPVYRITPESFWRRVQTMFSIGGRTGAPSQSA